LKGLDDFVELGSEANDVFTVFNSSPNMTLSETPKIWNTDGYCYTLLVAHTYRLEMARNLGKFPTVRVVTAYINDNKIPVNSIATGYRSCGGSNYHLYESDTGHVTADTISIFPSNAKLGGFLLVEKNTIQEPNEPYVQLSTYR
jgi:hypothetical protein